MDRFSIRWCTQLHDPTFINFHWHPLKEEILSTDRSARKFQRDSRITSSFREGRSHYKYRIPPSTSQNKKKPQNCFNTFFRSFLMKTLLLFNVYKEIIVICSLSLPCVFVIKTIISATICPHPTETFQRGYDNRIHRVSSFSICRNNAGVDPGSTCHL